MDSEFSSIFIPTNIGNIAVFRSLKGSEKTPVIFLHGVYFDHHLWDDVIQNIHDRTLITIDMPLHGESRKITNADWNLYDCADMLLEILDSLQISRVIAIGHSWGSMTILRAAHRHPERFAAIGLCNMPILAATWSEKAIFGFQHSMLMFRNFYTKQAGKTLFGKKALKEKPHLIDQLKRPMNILSDKEIKLIDQKVILDAEDATNLVFGLKMKAIALKGDEDYVPAPQGMECVIVKSGHISPLEDPAGVCKMISRLI